MAKRGKSATDIISHFFPKFMGLIEAVANWQKLGNRIAGGEQAH